MDVRNPEGKPKLMPVVSVFSPDKPKLNRNSEHIPRSSAAGLASELKIDAMRPLNIFN